MRELKQVERYSETGETSIRFFADKNDKMRAYCVPCGFFQLFTVPDKEMETYDDAKKIIDDIDRIYHRGGWVVERVVSPKGHPEAMGAWQEEAEEEYVRANDGKIYYIYREDDEGIYDLVVSDAYPQGLCCIKCNCEVLERWLDDDATIVIDGELHKGKTVYRDDNGHYWEDEIDVIHRLDFDTFSGSYFLA